MTASIIGKRPAESIIAPPHKRLATAATGSAPTQNLNNFSVYIYAETSGVVAATDQILEIAFKIINQNKEVESYFSTVKIAKENWDAINPEVFAANGLTWNHIQQGKTTQQIATEVNDIFEKHRLTRQNCRIKTIHESFIKPFVVKLCPNLNQYEWRYIEQIFETQVQNNLIPGTDPQSFPSVYRNHIAISLNITSTPKPHSAMTLVNWIMSTYHKVMNPNPSVTPLHLNLPVYEGTKRLRDMELLHPYTPAWEPIPGEVELVRGSVAWEKWHDEGIGSSDIPVIMGVSPWKTARQLLAEKKGKPKMPLTQAQLHGKNHHRAALQAFVEETGWFLREACIQNPNRSYLRASIYTIPRGKVIVLVICPLNKRVCHEARVNGTLHDYYLYKALGQLIVCPTAEQAICWLWHPHMGGAAIAVQRNAEVEAKINQKVNSFHLLQ